MEHITPIHTSLNWLPVTADFKILLFFYKVLSGLIPSYVAGKLLATSTFKCL